MGWSLEQFRALDVTERDFWIAWQYRRAQRLNDLLSRLMRGDKPYAETITMQLLLHMLRNG